MLEDLIVKTYTPYQTTLREVARLCNTDHHKVKYTLLKHGIEIVKGKIGPFSKEHKKKISKACKGRVSWIVGRKMPKKSLYKNMAVHLRFDIGHEWLEQFDDIEKLKVLNNAITKKGDRYHLSTEEYMCYIKRFYNDA